MRHSQAFDLDENGAADAEVEHPLKQGADRVNMGEREIANGMLASLDQVHWPTNSQE
ncbi:MAG: hypothetical protein K0M55_08005 [Rhizobium sp.]|nr:hypothetical protein [Rhizobium sp.]